MPALVIGVQHDAPLACFCIRRDFRRRTSSYSLAQVLFPVWQQKEIADTLRQETSVWMLDVVHWQANVSQRVCWQSGPVSCLQDVAAIRPY